MEKFFSLRHKGRGKAYQATFCFLGETKSFGTGETNYHLANQKCLKVQPDIIKSLWIPCANTSCGTWSPTRVSLEPRRWSIRGRTFNRGPGLPATAFIPASFHQPIALERCLGSRFW
jgi:hypothetical protein